MTPAEKVEYTELKRLESLDLTEPGGKNERLIMLYESREAEKKKVAKLRYRLSLLGQARTSPWRRRTGSCAIP